MCIFEYPIHKNLTRGRSGNYVILNHVNAFIVEDSILWHLGDTSDYTDGHENWSQGWKIDPITHPKPCNGYSFFPCFSWIFF